MSCTAPRCAPLIDGLFLGRRVAAWRLRRLWRHLGACAICRGYYDRVALVGGNMWDGPATGNDPPQLVAALADELAESMAARGGERRASAARWLMAATGIAGAAAVLTVALRNHDVAVGTDSRGGTIGAGGSRGDWAERGTGTVTARLRGVRAYCLGDGPDGGAVVFGSAASAIPPATTPALHCLASGRVQFAYTLGAGAPEYLVIFGRGEARWNLSVYEPPPGQDTSTPLRAGSDDEPLASSIRLRGSAPGVVVVDALFSTRPLSARTLRTLVEKGREPGVGDGVTERQQLRIVVAPE